MSSEISDICHFEASKIYRFIHCHGSEKSFRWPKRLFHIFPTYWKSISINRTNSHVHTTRRSEQSAKKLKFDAATYTFKITMFKFWLPVFEFSELPFVFPFILLPTQQANRKLPNLAKMKKFRGVRMTPSTQ